MVNKIKVLFYLLCLLNVGLVLCYFSTRNAFHLDEKLSYAHANSTQWAYLSPRIDSYMKDNYNDISYKWLDAKIFHDYLTVQEQERFSYKHISSNLLVVEHPPLYFVLLHTICSFFPDTFDKWHGGVLNVIFFMLTLVMLYKLSRLFFKDDITAMLPVFLWGFSTAGLAAVMYIRMYMLQVLLAVCLIYETLKILREDDASNKRLFLIFLCSALGILTQYNSLFFSFFVTMSTGMVLLCRKNWQLLWRYSLAMLCSVLVLFVIFPEAFNVLLFSFRSEEARRIINIKNISWLFWDRIFECLRDVYLMQFFCFRESYSFIGVVFILLLTLALYAPRKKNDICWLLAISILFAFFMTCLMPKMAEFWLRYVMCIMPFVAILTIYLVIRGGEALNIPRKYMLIFLGFGILVNSALTDFGNRSVFSFRIPQETIKIINMMREKKILVVSPVFAFLDGVSYYEDSERVFRVNDLCEAQGILNEADYVWHFHTAVQRHDEVREPFSRECSDGLIFISIISLSSHYFEVYKVIKAENFSDVVGNS